MLTCRVDITQASDIDLSLNLRYMHPADTSQGGIWSLVGLTDDLNGIASVRAILDNVDNGPGDVTFPSGIGAVDPVDLGGGLRPAVIASGSILDLAYGQDLVGTVIPGVSGFFGRALMKAAAGSGSVLFLVVSKITTSLEEFSDSL